MRSLALVALCLLPLAAAAKKGKKPAADAEPAPPTIQRLLRPSPALLEGCVRAACVSARALRVCKCLAGEGARIRVESAGARAEWTATSFMTDVADFEVLLADLDGDRAREVVVVNRDAVSNGMAVESSTLYAWSPARPSEAPASLLLQDSGHGTVSAKGGKVRVLETRWRELTDGKRGAGTYFVGRFVRLEGGRFVPAEKGYLVRRYLEGFERQRIGALDACRAQTGCGRPLEWLRHPSTEKREQLPPEEKVEPPSEQ